MRQRDLDFLELLKIFFHHKYLIILTTISLAMIAYGITFLVSEKWTSTAVLTTPKLVDVQQTVNLKQKYLEELSVHIAPQYTKLKTTTPKNKENDNDDDSEDKITNNIFKSLMVNAISLDLRREYLTSTSLYTKEKFETAEEQQKLLAKLLKNMNVKCGLNLELSIQQCEMSFSAKTPKVAKQILENYIDYINSKTNEEFYSDNVLELNQSLNSLEIEQNNLIIKAVQQRNSSLNKQKINYSYQITGIEPKLYEKNDNLPLNLPVQYYQLQAAIKNINTLIDRYNQINVKSYRYLQSPSLPINIDSPNRILMLLCGAALGLLIGCYSSILLAQNRYKK